MEPTTLPDPNVSTLDKLYSSGAFFCLGILALFFVVRYLTKHWAWLREGQRHVWAVAFLGGLATLVVPASQGSTPNTSMLVAVAITIGSILVDPKKVAAISSALVLVLVLLCAHLVLLVAQERGARREGGDRRLHEGASARSSSTSSSRLAEVVLSGAVEQRAGW
jgi:hypothetical protein